MAIIEGILTLLVAIAIAVVLYWLFKRGVALIVNAIVGIVILFLINLLDLMRIFGQPDIPINWLTVLISAIGGLVGVLIIVLLHIVGISLAV
ncbi:MAG: pro-sigmaK processing inhibitor BofA family protein [Methanomicrobiales archaeon]|nr:pro-sigmaK processing inhibitor BofA family protein [Methanomicrobiales archaeon]MDI6876699.1 pro-sigmaK processing inhibitor BofA family protein [Methanomicrobiales archaeon]